MRQIYLKTNKGFTLIELMVTIAIMGILASIATPSFQSYIQEHQAGKVGTTLYSNLRSLRQLAITNANRIVICASSNQSTCLADASSNKNWAIGWIAFSDLNSNDQRDSDTEDILIIQTPIVDGKITLSSGPILSFNFQGEVDAPVQFSICSNNEDADLSRAVLINQVGRAMFVNPEQLSGTITCS